MLYWLMYCSFASVVVVLIDVLFICFCRCCIDWCTVRLLLLLLYWLMYCSFASVDVVLIDVLFVYFCRYCIDVMFICFCRCCIDWCTVRLLLLLLYWLMYCSFASVDVVLINVMFICFCRCCIDWCTVSFDSVDVVRQGTERPSVRPNAS